MARIRSIKPDFFNDEDLAEIDPYARLVFIGLWCVADREGKLEDRPKKLKTVILPYDNVDFDKILSVLSGDNPVNKKFIIRYEINGERYIKVSNFLEHQRPHNTEAKSTVPEPINNGELTVNPPLLDVEPLTGKERKGREGKYIKAAPSAAIYSQDLVDKAKKAEVFGFNVYQQVAIYNKGKCNRIPESVMIEILDEFFKYRGTIKGDVFPYMKRVITEKSRRFWSEKNVAEHEEIKRGPVAAGSVLRQLAESAV